MHTPKADSAAADAVAQAALQQTQDQRWADISFDSKVQENPDEAAAQAALQQSQDDGIYGGDSKSTTEQDVFANATTDSVPMITPDDYAFRSYPYPGQMGANQPGSGSQLADEAMMIMTQVQEAQQSWCQQQATMGFIPSVWPMNGTVGAPPLNAGLPTTMML